MQFKIIKQMQIKCWGGESVNMDFNVDHLGYEKVGERALENKSTN